jgi:YidC/Oxa1 family membrane protein insertase
MNSKNSTIIGFTLLFVLFLLYTWMNSPSQKQIDAYKANLKKYQDSIALSDSLSKLAEVNGNLNTDSLKLLQDKIAKDSTKSQTEKDSILKSLELDVKNNGGGSAAFGSFSSSTGCEEKTFKIENDKLVVTFSNKGGRIVDVQIKGYLGYDHSTKNKYDKVDVHLMSHKADKFSYFIPITGAARGGVNTQDLCFEPTVTGKTITFRAFSDEKKGFIEQKYNLDKGYLIDYDLKLEGLRDLIPGDAQNISLLWHAHLPKLEKNAEYERRMTSIHFKETESSPSYCTCASDATENITKSVQWISYAQQFFNSSLIVKGNVKPNSADLRTMMMPESSAHMKDLVTKLNFPIADQSTLVYDMEFFIGPNQHTILADLNVGLEQIIPFGWSIFGVISRYVIRPLFNFLGGFIPSYGLVIIILTLLIRVLLFPLQFSMLKSGVKMSILRPRLDELKKKYKDDPQGLQMEQMRMYGEYGVSPLAGCLPMLLTMPIWIALYRFFPAAIEFRQKSFLWADDLVSYDSIWDFGTVPFINSIYGDHVSLFTLLWCISMFAFLIYNSKQMDMSAGGANAKMMMYMQYSFPVIFFFALNNYSAGLTCYMLFGNLLNILQTFLVKNVFINKKKLEEKMEHRKNNPKPKSAFQQRYEDALKQQQELKKNQKKGK